MNPQNPSPALAPSSAPEAIRQHGNSSCTFLPALLALILFIACFALFTRNNQFNYYYHVDEKGKVAQIQTGEWNFHHPMLMLSTVRVAASFCGSLEDPQRVVEIGRTVSAALAAGGVVFLSAAMWLMAGRFAATATGLLLLTNHQVFELAHYFKEDTSLLFGMGAWLAALALYWKRPSATTAALVGAGAALAISGKWVGAFALVFSLGLVPWRASEKRTLSILSFLGALIAVFALFNLPLLLQHTTVEQSFNREIDKLAGDDRNLSRSLPHGTYWNAFRNNVFMLLWPFLLVQITALWRKRREVTAPEVLLLLIPILIAVPLSFIPKSNDRYFFPATLLLLCSVAWGMEQLRRRWSSHGILVGLLGFVILAQGVGKPGRDLLSYYRAFCVDDRTDLIAWLNVNCPHAILAQDGAARLLFPDVKDTVQSVSTLVPKVILRNFDGIADLAALRATGVTHVVLSPSIYAKFFMKSMRPKEGLETPYENRRAFYKALLKGKLLWERPHGLVIVLHPGLQVYELPKE